MAISYSAIVNYGKATLPSVESWGTNMNILRDPPRSLTTRKIDKVGETSAITTALADSGDRYCEAINYYPRGVNPMVSVSYNNDNAGVNGSSTQAYLPYRVARDGAFRPPIWRQEDLLPLSRMPRIWTEVNTQPYAPIFTLRMRDCGTAETTKEVKDKLMTTSCVANRTLFAYPNVNAPETINRSIIIDPLAPGQVNAPRSCVTANDVENRRKYAVGPILLAPNRPLASGSTNLRFVKETPTIRRVDLTLNHPLASGYTNKSASALSGNVVESHEFNRLPPKPRVESCPVRPSIPTFNGDVASKNLIKVR